MIFFFFYFSQLFINNDWVDQISVETFHTKIPSTGEVITEFQKSGKVSYF